MLKKILFFLIFVECLVFFYYYMYVSHTGVDGAFLSINNAIEILQSTYIQKFIDDANELKQFFLDEITSFANIFADIPTSNGLEVVFDYLGYIAKCLIAIVRIVVALVGGLLVSIFNIVYDIIYLFYGVVEQVTNLTRYGTSLPYSISACTPLNTLGV